MIYACSGTLNFENTSFYKYLPWPSLEKVKIGAKCSNLFM
jgi:hypothetical protein